MAQFTNQAQLSYGNVVTNSNIAVGEISQALSITKTAILPDYSTGDSVSYVISIINSSPSAINGLTLLDNLGAYEFGGTSVVPLTYVDGSVKLFLDGVLASPPTVSVGTGVIFSGINIGAGQNAILAYEADVNSFAPADAGGEVVNTATLSGGGITPISASETISARIAPNVSITKSISPVPVAPNGEVTYTFVISNSGNSELAEIDGAVIRDIFNPILTNVSVSFNGVSWQEGVNYTYNETSGEFETVAGQVTVGAGQYVQDPTTGEWVLTEATSTLVITGNIGSI
ncbi:MAG: hypothetical protein IJZ04_07470 [Clostridia bacterium]|nr:hypothetical protein [Clostridia bacterium]